MRNRKLGACDWEESMQGPQQEQHTEPVHLSALSGAPEKDLPDSHEDINLFSVFPATDPDEIGLVRREEIELIKGYRKPQPPLLFSSK